MREIDLIPASYRLARRRDHWLKLLVGTSLGLVVSTGLARVWLDTAVEAAAAEVARLEIQQTIATGERDRLAAMELERQTYEERLYLLEGLRSGAAATELFDIIEQALIDDEVWFRSWDFRRAGVTDPEGQSIESGYFVMVPATAAADEAWRVETHMTIAGQAVDHGALSRFVQRLLAHPTIENVRIRRTDLKRYATRSLVDFDLAIIINRSVRH